MSTTTGTLIRDRASAVIKALVPQSLSGDRFVEHRAELDGDFREYVKGHPDSAWRRYQVRDEGTSTIPEVSNTDVEETMLDLEVVVAYRQDHRAGGGAAYRRDAVIDEDYRKINFAIGWCGRSNFPAGSAYDACWRGGEPKQIERDDENGIDFLVMTLRYSYQLART